MTPSAPQRLRVISALCMVWMVVFAAVHTYWALGGALLLPSGFRVNAHAALFAVDIAAIPLCLIGAVLARTWVLPIARRHRRLVLALTACTGGLGVVHASDAVVSWIGMAIGVGAAPTAPAERFSVFVYEPWWFTGGVLFLIASAFFLAATKHVHTREEREPSHA